MPSKQAFCASLVAPSEAWLTRSGLTPASSTSTAPTRLSSPPEKRLIWSNDPATVGFLPPTATLKAFGLGTKSSFQRSPVRKDNIVSRSELDDLHGAASLTGTMRWNSRVHVSCDSVARATRVSAA